MSDLFPDAPVEEVLPKERGLDLRTEYLKDRYNLSDEWVWRAWESIGTGYTHTLFKGGVYRHAIQRGKYKGRTDFKKPEPGSEMELVLEDAAFEAWLPVWEQRTGKCSTCHGSGQKWVGWHHIDGNRFVACPRCGATGNAPASCDTHPQDGDVKQAPLVSGAVPEGQTPNA